MAHKLAGTPVQEQDIIDVQTLVDAYFDNAPDITHRAIVVHPYMVLLPIYM